MHTFETVRWLEYTVPVDYDGDEESSVAINTNNDYRTPLPSETCTYELIGVKPKSTEGDVTNLFRFEDMGEKVQEASDGNHDIPYEDTFASNEARDVPYRRLIEHVCTYYRRDDLNNLQDTREGLLPLGRFQSLGLPGEVYKLAFTEGLPALVYGDRITAEMLANEGGYVYIEGDANWWMPSGRIFYAPSGDNELTFAREHFFLPHRFRDPFGNETNVIYDSDPNHNHNLLVVETRDALGNIVTVNTQDDSGNPPAIRNDYRVLQPYWVTDPNGNRTQAAFDALGMVVATAVMGKAGEGKGDFIDNTFVTDPDLSQLQDFLKDPRGTALDLLKTASTRIIYDLDRYQRCGQPLFAATLAREIHFRDQGGADSPVQIRFGYSDGFGREIQTKVQAEAGDAPMRNPESETFLRGSLPQDTGDIKPGQLVYENNLPVKGHTDHRWVGTGRIVYNNKGKPSKKYEPFFSSTHLYEPETDMTDTGVTPILFYDPVERVVATLHPNHTYEKAVFDPWQQKTYDVNDTVAFDPRTDEDIMRYTLMYFKSLPDDWKTWLQERDIDPENPPENKPSLPPEQKAAVRTLPHRDTPTVAHLDTLVVCSVSNLT